MRCPTCGHSRGKLDPEEVREIRRRKGEKLAAIAAEYGVSEATISTIRAGKAYQWVTE